MKNQSKFYVQLIIGVIFGSGIFTGCQLQDEKVTPEPDVGNIELMKRLKIFTLILSTLLGSCDKESSTAAIRRVINETSNSVIINVYGDDEKFNYSLNAFDTLNINGTCFCCVLEYCDLGWTTSLAFGEIIFDGEKIQQFEDLPDSCEEKSINADPISGCYGYVEANKNGTHVFTYRITQ